MTVRGFPVILTVVLALSVGLTAQVGVAPARRLVTVWCWPGTSRS
jgi:hypothetical protein